MRTDTPVRGCGSLPVMGCRYLCRLCTQSHFDEMGVGRYFSLHTGHMVLPFFHSSIPTRCLYSIELCPTQSHTFAAEMRWARNGARPVGCCKRRTALTTLSTALSTSSRGAGYLHPASSLKAEAPGDY